MHAQAKRKRSKDDSVYWVERLNKRIKETAEAQNMDVADISVNQENERELWDCGSDLQWALDAHCGSIDAKLVQEATGEVKFMEAGRGPVGIRGENGQGPCLNEVG